MIGSRVGFIPDLRGSCFSSGCRGSELSKYLVEGLCDCRRGGASLPSRLLVSQSLVSEPRRSASSIAVVWVIAAAWVVTSCSPAVAAKSNVEEQPKQTPSAPCECDNVLEQPESAVEAIRAGFTRNKSELTGTDGMGFAFVKLTQRAQDAVDKKISTSLEHTRQREKHGTVGDLADCLARIMTGLFDGSFQFEYGEMLKPQATEWHGFEAHAFRVTMTKRGDAGSLFCISDPTTIWLSPGESNGGYFMKCGGTKKTTDNAANLPNIAKSAPPGHIALFGGAKHPQAPTKIQIDQLAENNTEYRPWGVHGSPLSERSTTLLNLPTRAIYYMNFQLEEPAFSIVE